MAAGSTEDLVDDVLNIIKWNYNAMRNRNPAQGEAFRLMIQTILSDPRSKVFDGKGDFTMIDLSREVGK
jgi:hypothetical protein